MRVAHFAVFAPSQSGMYESTRDQIKYERRNGLDSIFIDGVRPTAHEMGLKDSWLEPVNWREALECDIWVTHSNFPHPLREYIDYSQKNREKFKIVSIHHGPVEHMLMKEWFNMESEGEDFGFTFTHINAIWNWDACVVLNQHEYDVSVLYDENDKLVYIPNSIDLERIQKHELKWQYRHHPAIISCDSVRIEKLPFHALFAMPRVIEKIPNARMNIFGIPLEHIRYFRQIVMRSKNRMLQQGCLENYQMKQTTLFPFIAGADIGINNNYSGIMSRVHMEMMALGIPVVSYNGDYTPYHATIFNLQSIADNIVQCWEDLNDSRKKVREKTIKYANKHFDRAIQVKKYIELYKKLLEEK